jgi:hypothetical protein
MTYKKLYESWDICDAGKSVPVTDEVLKIDPRVGRK